MSISRTEANRIAESLAYARVQAFTVEGLAKGGAKVRHHRQDAACFAADQAARNVGIALQLGDPSFDRAAFLVACGVSP